jgi:hypothetical protein
MAALALASLPTISALSTSMRRIESQPYSASLSDGYKGHNSGHTI